jgi:patatin-like phospholipase/acyl hydrolase
LNLNFDDVYADELLVTSYEYNSKTPRFYSKYFRTIDPGRYDVKLWTAVSASSSAPIYFDPKTHTNEFDIEETLIDGGLICNNPSLYAFQMARHIHGHDDIRLMSLGTGESETLNSTLNNT